MSDITVIIGQLITGAVTIISLVITLKLKAKADILATKAEGIEQVQNKISSKQDTIHVQINGMKTELIDTTKQLGEEIGKKIGRAEKKQEEKPINEENLAAAEEKGKLAGREEMRKENEHGH